MTSQPEWKQGVHNPGIMILLRGLPGTSAKIIFFIDMTEYLLDTTEEKDYFVLHFRRGHSPLSQKTWQQKCVELVTLDPQSGSTERWKPVPITRPPFLDLFSQAFFWVQLPSFRMGLQSTVDFL